MAGLKGFKRWIALGVAAFAVLLAVAAFAFRVDILRTALDPRIPFQTYTPPPAPEYADPRAWVLPIDARSPGVRPKEADEDRSERTRSVRERGPHAADARMGVLRPGGVAERAGFEPATGFPEPHFQCGAIVH